MCTADSSTSTDAVMLTASSRSSAKPGSGTSMTKTSATAATGMIHSAARFPNAACGLSTVFAIG